MRKPVKAAVAGILGGLVVLAVTRAGAENLFTTCSGQGKAYGYINANRDFWITLTPNSLTTSTNWCENTECKLPVGLEYDTGSQWHFELSPSYKLSYANPTALTITPGLFWQEPYSYGSLCGGPGVECAGPWPGDWCVGYETLRAAEYGVALAKDWLDAGYTENFSFYVGKFRRGVQQGDTCTGSDHGCTWFTVTMPAKLGSQHGFIQWEGFYEILGGSGHPNCCSKECCQLVKPAGPGTPVRPSTWSATKELYR